MLGPTGVGKTTLLLNLIAQDIAAGRGVVVIEPNGDLIADVLVRVPAKWTGDVVLLDPTDREYAVGLNSLTSGGRPPELVADPLLGPFHSLYAERWGPRTQDILGASLLTLARVPGSTLTALPLLLTDAGYRRRVVGSLTRCSHVTRPQSQAQEVASPMHDQSTQREALHDPCEAERQTDNTILGLMFDDASSWPWSVEEIARELADPRKARDAVCRLAEHGLVHRIGDFVWPTRTARRAAEIEIGT